MGRKISQGRLLLHGKYSPQVISHYIKAVKFEPRLSIGTFAKMYQPNIAAQMNPDYCPAVGPEQKLDVHKRIMQSISVDTLASCLAGNPKDQCNAFMQNPDSLHALLSAKIMNHPVCPKTMDFYSQVLGKTDPVQFHGQLVNAIVASMQDGWRDFIGKEWNFCEAPKFRKYFSKRVQQFTNLEASVEVDIGVQEPDLEPISTFVDESPPAAEPISRHKSKHQLYDERSDDESMQTMEHYDTVGNHGGSHSSSCSSSEEELGDEEPPAGLTVKNVLVDTQSPLKPYNAAMSLKVPAPKVGAYRPTLQDIPPVAEPIDHGYRSGSGSGSGTDDESSSMEVDAKADDVKAQSVQANLIPLSKGIEGTSNKSVMTPTRGVRPTLEATVNNVSAMVASQTAKVEMTAEQTAAALLQSRLVPLNPPAKVTPPRTIAPDALGGEALPPGKARRANLVAIGAEVAQNRKPVVSTAVPVAPVAKRAMTPVIVDKEQQPTGTDKFAAVNKSIRWLEAYLDTEGPKTGENLVFFAPVNGVAARIVEQSAKKGKLVGVKAIIQRHLCEHTGDINESSLTTIGGHTIQIGARGKIQMPAVKSAWTDFIGVKNIAGFNVQIFSHQNLFTHE